MRWRILTFALVAAVGAAAGALRAPAAAAPGSVAAATRGTTAAAPDDTYAALRAARPDGRVAVVHGLTLSRDAFRITFEAGEIHFLAPVAGRTVGAVFLGRGSLRLDPPQPAELRQLALAQGDAAATGLADSFDEMVLWWSDDTAAEIAAAAPPERQPAPSPRARQAYERWLGRQRQELHVNLQLQLLRDLLAPPAAAAPAGLFLALFEGKRAPLALIAADRRGVGEVVGGFRLGAAAGMLYVPDPRRGGFWYLGDAAAGPTAGATDAAAAGGDPPPAPAEALHYRVETTVQRNVDLGGVTVIDLAVRTSGLRVLPLNLAGGLRLAEVSYRLSTGAGAAAGGSPAAAEEGAAGPVRAAAWVQEDAKEDGGDAAVVFPEPLAAGTRLQLRLVYQGDAVLRDAGDKNFYVDARTSWYPNLGAFGAPVPFDLTYRVPAGNQVISVGRLAGASEAGGQAVSHWQAAGGIRVAGFNYGRFKEVERHDETTGIDIQVFTNPGTPDAVRSLNAAMEGGPRASTGLLPPGTLYNTAPGPSLGVVNTSRLAESALADGVNAARIFTTYFGPLADKHIAITQQSQWTFGQSWPSLVFMPYLAFLDSTQRQRLGLAGARDFVDQVGFHELSHQWWGNLVSAATYRDLWLEEGFAEFSAALAVQHTQGWGAYDHIWREARKRLFETARHTAAASVEAGPITQGFRLTTWRTPLAYQSLVYGKGAYVLHMLRMLLWDGSSPEPDHRFVELMHDYTASFAGRAATTADFAHVVERHMVPAMNAAGDNKMDWFFRQWVYGTEVPRYTADLHLDSAGDQLRVSGRITQEGVGDDFHAQVPLYLEFANHQYVRIGLVPITGKTSAPVDLTLRTPRKPLGVAINARSEVLARH